jgi:hypothetical protein
MAFAKVPRAQDHAVNADITALIGPKGRSIPTDSLHLSGGVPRIPRGVACARRAAFSDHRRGFDR